MLSTRLLTAAVALPAVLAAIIFLPAAGFTLFIMTVLGWGLYEVVEMTNARSISTVVVVALAGIGSALLLLHAPMLWPLPAAVIAMMIALVFRVGSLGGEGGPHGAILALIGAFYVGALYPYFALLRNSPGGIELIILVLMLVVASDSGAYFAGQYLGRHKLAPRVSPKKTWEGAAGGLALSIIAGLILRSWLAPAWDAVTIVIASASVAVLAQLGDLAGSAYKRTAGVKDSGWIFPGHGGLIDRTCSLVLAAVFTYYYSR